MSPVTKISRVLVGVDFDDASASALKMAGVLASAWDAEITVVHAAALELPAYFTGAQIVALQAEREKSRGNCHPAAPIGRSARPAHRSRGGGGRPTTRRDSANGAFTGERLRTAALDFIDTLPTHSHGRRCIRPKRCQLRYRPAPAPAADRALCNNPARL